MATGINTEIRLGGVDIKIYAYGNDFTTALHTISNHNVDGLNGSLDTFEKLIESGRRPGYSKAFAGIKGLNFEIALDYHGMEEMALSFGLTLADVTDNTGNTPPDLSIDVGTKISLTEYEVEILAPQDEDETLFDVFQLYKAYFMPAWTQKYTIQEERFIPLKFIGIKDPNNSDKIFRCYSEGVAIV